MRCSWFAPSVGGRISNGPVVGAFGCLLAALPLLRTGSPPILSLPISTFNAAFPPLNRRCNTCFASPPPSRLTQYPIRVPPCSISSLFPPSSRFWFGDRVHVAISFHVQKCDSMLSTLTSLPISRTMLVGYIRSISISVPFPLPLSVSPVRFLCRVVHRLFTVCLSPKTASSLFVYHACVILYLYLIYVTTTTLSFGPLLPLSLSPVFS